MKKKKCLAVLIAIFVSAQAPADDPAQRKPDSGNKLKKFQLSAEQQSCLDVYRTWRARVIFTLKLSDKTISQDSTPEQILRAGAPKINLPKNAKWEDVLALPWARKTCTEERRKKYGVMFCANEQATWVEILFSIESMRLQDDAAKASRAQATGGRFFSTKFQRQFSPSSVLVTLCSYFDSCAILYL